MHNIALVWDENVSAHALLERWLQDTREEEEKGGQRRGES